MIRRSDFVPDHLKAVAAATPDMAIPLMNGMTVPGERVTKLMVDLLDVAAGERVLLIGTGSGYQTAVLAEAGAIVDSVDIRHVAGLEQKMPKGVHLFIMDGLVETPRQTYDAILCTCAVPGPMLCWMTALKAGGRLVAPVGGRETHAIRKYLKVGVGLSDQGDFAYCSFVAGEMVVSEGLTISVFDAVNS